MHANHGAGMLAPPPAMSRDDEKLPITLTVKQWRKIKTATGEMEWTKFALFTSSSMSPLSRRSVPAGLRSCRPSARRPRSCTTLVLPRSSAPSDDQIRIRPTDDAVVVFYEKKESADV
jgi:hypothetical protein